MRKLAWERLQKNIVMLDIDTMIDKRTGAVLNPEADSTYGKTNFKAIFMVVIYQKITCCRWRSFIF